MRRKQSVAGFLWGCIALMGSFMVAADQYETAVFAGGCFWCTESDFEKLSGVVEVISGYTGGASEEAIYQQVASGQTEHIESVQVVFDPSKVRYEALLDAFWRHIDPTDAGGQFVDRGNQYRSVIFYQNKDQQHQAETSRDALAQSGRFKKPLVTEILPATPFYPAEDYHQNYYRENPLRYRYYRHNSGRDQFLESVWGRDVHPDYVKPDQEALRQTLTALSYEVTQQEGTEPSFKNAFWDHKSAGLYVDVVTGEPLFSSTDKFDSGTGWPSFVKPVESKHVVEKTDRKLFSVRTEVRSYYGDSHLGHVFEDGPTNRGGLRYCINSAALRFIPANELSVTGYGKFSHLFEE
jgi:peptide methionine sulfoxide reductase msrA/msrB